MTDSFYDQGFYEEISDGSRRSASVVVPLVLRVLPGIQSIVDFGCGAGVWLAEFSLCGVPRITGLDFGGGTETYMFIPRESFRVRDLSRPVLGIDAHDLAISLEVAEHLPETAAEGFVASITSAADVVLFSAATPLQGGHNHVNERWPSYWVRLFQQSGFRCCDVIRPLIWNDKRVEWWYRQNLLLFVKKGLHAPGLHHLASFEGRDLIHPDNLTAHLAVPRLRDDDGETRRRLEWARDGAAERVRPPRSTPLRRILRLVRNLERSVRKVVARAKGQSYAQFKARWEARCDRRLIRRSGLFDAAWYAATYGDVAGSGLTPLKHFLRVGLYEGRDPGPLFSCQWYASRNPPASQGDVHPLLRFLRDRAFPIRAPAARR